MTATAPAQKSSDAALRALTSSVGEIMPTPYEDRSSFVVVLPHSVKEVCITPTARAEGAAITVSGQRVESGKPSQAIALAVGQTAIPVVVTAPDGVKKLTFNLKAQRAVATPDWELLTEHAPFTNRDSAGEVVFNNELWILGGYVPELVTDTWHSADGKNWQQGGSIPNDSGINIPVNFTFAGKMWVSSNDGKFYSCADGQAWTLVAEKLPWSGRYAAGSTVFQNKMWVVGGYSAGEWNGDVWSSSDGVNWTLECEKAPWSRRQWFGNIVVHNGQMFAIGGGIVSYQPFRAYREVWSSPDGKNWTLVTDDAPWVGRIWSSAVSYANRLWMLTGFRGQPVWENRRDCWYSADGKEWKQLETEHMWSARHEASCYVKDDALWLVAGNAWPLVNDVWRLKISGLTFTSQPVLEEYMHASYRYQAQADFHKSAGALKYKLVAAPKWLSIDEKTGVVRGVASEPGDHKISIEASDAAGETARQEYVLNVISFERRV